MKKICSILLLLSFFTTTKGSVSDNGNKNNVPLFQKKTIRSGHSQSCFDDNTHIISIGVGFGGGDKYYKGSKDSAYSFKTTPAYCLTYEQSLKPHIGPGYLGIGAYLGYQDTHYRYINKYYYNGYYYDHEWKHFMVAIRSAYHWEVLNSSTSEVYIGALIGARIQNYSYTTNDLTAGKNDYKLNKKSTYPTYSAFIGARWYCGSYFSLFAEAGYGISYFTAGISFKF